MIKRAIKSYVSVLNHRVFVSIFMAILATYLSHKYKLIFNLDLTLVSVAVVFPLVFTLGSAFERRERALEHLGRAKGALAAIKYCFSFSAKTSDADKELIYAEIIHVKTELIRFLHTNSNDKTDLNKAINKIQAFILLHANDLGRSLSLRVYRLMRDVIMGVENTISIKMHRTPKSIRAYCLLFIYIFPFFYAPTLIWNIEYQVSEIGEIMNSRGIFANRYAMIVYVLNIVISFILIVLFNVQEQIENPFDQDGIDDIQLENYELDY